MSVSVLVSWGSSLRQLFTTEPNPTHQIYSTGSNQSYYMYVSRLFLTLSNRTHGCTPKQYRNCIKNDQCFIRPRRSVRQLWPRLVYRSISCPFCQSVRPMVTTTQCTVQKRLGQSICRLAWWVGWTKLKVVQIHPREWAIFRGGEIGRRNAMYRCRRMWH